MVEIDSDGHDEPTEESVVRVRAGGLGKGQVTKFLEPGETVEIRDDDPNWIKVEALEVEE